MSIQKYACLLTTTDPTLIASTASYARNVPPAILVWNILIMLSKLQEPPTSESISSSSPSVISLPTLSKAARRSFLEMVPSCRENRETMKKSGHYFTCCRWRWFQISTARRGGGFLFGGDLKRVTIF